MVWSKLCCRFSLWLSSIAFIAESRDRVCLWIKAWLEIFNCVRKSTCCLQGSSVKPASAFVIKSPRHGGTSKLRVQLLKPWMIERIEKMPDYILISLSLQVSSLQESPYVIWESACSKKPFPAVDTDTICIKGLCWIMHSTCTFSRQIFWESCSCKTEHDPTTEPESQRLVPERWVLGVGVEERASSTHRQTWRSPQDSRAAGGRASAQEN